MLSQHWGTGRAKARVGWGRCEGAGTQMKAGAVQGGAGQRSKVEKGEGEELAL